MTEPVTANSDFPSTQTSAQLPNSLPGQKPVLNVPIHPGNLDYSAGTEKVGQSPNPPKDNKTPWFLIAATVIIVLGVIAGGLIWWFANSHSAPGSKVNEVGQTAMTSESVASPTLDPIPPSSSVNGLPAYLQNLVGLSPGTTYLQMMTNQKNAQDFAEYFDILAATSGTESAGLLELSKTGFQYMYESQSDDWLHDNAIFVDFVTKYLGDTTIIDEQINGNTATITVQTMIGYAATQQDGVTVNMGQSTNTQTMEMSLDPLTKIWMWNGTGTSQI